MLKNALVDFVYYRHVRLRDADWFVQQMTSFSTHGIAHRLINFHHVFTLIARG